MWCSKTFTYGMAPYGYEFNIPPSKQQAMPQVMVFNLVKKPDEQAGVTNVHADWGPFTAPTSRKLRVALHLHHFFGTGEEKIEVLINGKAVWHITDDASIAPPPSEVRPLLGGATDDGAEFKVAVSPEIDLSAVGGESQYSVTIKALDGRDSMNLPVANWTIVRVWLLHAAAPAR